MPQLVKLSWYTCNMHHHTYDDVIPTLKQAYDNHAGERDEAELADWKIVEREHFLALLQSEGKRSLLEIGAGPGHFGAFFRDRGLDVTCTDLSPEMVRLCRQKGLTAHVMDFLHLDFPPVSFDAVFALNCLLHVPGVDLDRVLAAVQRLLQPGGLFFYGVYGGHSFEGVWPEDHHNPKRYFVFYPDDELRRRVAGRFDEVSFRVIQLEDDRESHFQSLTLRPKPIPSQAADIGRAP